MNQETHNTNRRVAMVVSNPAVSAQTGWPIGFWWAELVHPYWEFTEAGYEITIFSPEGGEVQGDGYSDPEDASQYSAHDILSLGFKRSPQHAALLQNTPSLDDLKLENYDAIFLCGGQGPMYTFYENDKLHRLFAAFYEAGKIAAAICHATCILLKVKGSDGSLLVDGKTWTGFADSEEKYADQAAGVKIQPFWIEEEAHKLENTHFITHYRFAPFAVRDGNLITGQQQFSGTAAAREVIQALGVPQPPRH